MLVLSRRQGQVIWIGKEVSVVVIDIDRNRVRLGITAPKEVEILREELCATVWGEIPIGASNDNGNGDSA